MGLHNISTSDFSTQSSATCQTPCLVSGQDMILNHGTWHLEFGRGFGFEMLVLPRDVRDLNLRVVRDKKLLNAPQAKPVKKATTRAMHTGDLEKRAPSNSYVLTSTFAYLLPYRILCNRSFSPNHRYLRLSQPIQFKQRISTQSLCFPPSANHGI